MASPNTWISRARTLLAGRDFGFRMWVLRSRWTTPLTPRRIRIAGVRHGHNARRRETTTCERPARSRIDERDAAEVLIRAPSRNSGPRRRRRQFGSARRYKVVSGRRVVLPSSPKSWGRGRSARQVRPDERGSDARHPVARPFASPFTDTPVGAFVVANTATNGTCRLELLELLAELSASGCTHTQRRASKRLRRAEPPAPAPWFQPLFLAADSSTASPVGGLAQSDRETYCAQSSRQ